MKGTAVRSARSFYLFVVVESRSLLAALACPAVASGCLAVRREIAPFTRLGRLVLFGSTVVML